MVLGLDLNGVGGPRLQVERLFRKLFSKATGIDQAAMPAAMPPRTSPRGKQGTPVKAKPQPLPAAPDLLVVTATPNAVPNENPEWESKRYEQMYVHPQTGPRFADNSWQRAAHLDVTI